MGQGTHGSFRPSGGQCAWSAERIGLGRPWLFWWDGRNRRLRKLKLWLSLWSFFKSVIPKAEQTDRPSVSDGIKQFLLPNLITHATYWQKKPEGTKELILVSMKTENPAKLQFTFTFCLSWWLQAPSGPCHPSSGIFPEYEM